ncbi:hypothetical protein [Sphingomonas sp.]|uniref:hypothetical protein n=1 Tax=Sphingomonas sp. TaxID=28214 RepID=UPI003D6CCE47
MLTLEAAAAILQSVQIDLNAASAESWSDSGDAEIPRRFLDPDDCCTRLTVTDLGGVLAIDYYGSEYAGWEYFERALAQPGIAEHIGQLRIAGPDQGANGLKEWDFSGLIQAAPRFPRLTDFRISISDPGDHNQSCVADDQLPALLVLLPALRNLALPHAPEPGFFDLDLPELRWIRTGGDFRTRSFIRHLADATRLPGLHFVDFTDSLAPFMETEEGPPDWNSTPFEDYQRLFEAPIMERCRSFRLRNTRLSEDQYRTLQALRPECQFSVVLAPPHSYVSHWGNSRFPYRHLLPFG